MEDARYAHYKDGSDFLDHLLTNNQKTEERGSQLHYTSV